MRIALLLLPVALLVACDREPRKDEHVAFLREQQARFDKCIYEDDNALERILNEAWVRDRCPIMDALHLTSFEQQMICRGLLDGTATARRKGEQRCALLYKTGH